MSKNIIKTVGSILKKETLLNVPNEFSKKYFVLKNSHPYPGYYEQSIPDENILVPDSLFLITKEIYSHEKIFRIAQTIRNCCGINFNATPASIQVFNVTKSCIRIKGFDDLNNLENLVNEFVKYDIRIDKQGQIHEYKVLINVFKYFNVQETAKDEWADLDDKRFNYFRLKKFIEWEEFEEISLKIKHNIENNQFDVAQGVFYLDNSIVDVVRIYSDKIDNNRMDKIKDLYIKYVK